MLKCKKHPQYQGEHLPESECKMCSMVYGYVLGLKRWSHRVDAAVLELLGRSGCCEPVVLEEESEVRN